MTTNGDRPEDRLVGPPLRPATYSPRRRRNDVAVTGVIGFVVGAIFGIVGLGLVVLVAYIAELLVGFVGLPPVVIGVALVAGIFLAITVVRSSE